MAFDALDLLQVDLAMIEISLEVSWTDGYLGFYKNLSCLHPIRDAALFSYRVEHFYLLLVLYL